MHESIEALRWARSLIAAGTARPEEMAVAAASPAELDDHMLALRRETNLPVHFVHGVKAITERDGQAVAALAELLVKGLSQERVRRLFRLLHGRSPALADLPRDWARVLPMDAPLTTLDRWAQALANAADWPDGVDRSALVLDVLSLLAHGPDALIEVGERLLTGLALKLWRRALTEGPAAALPVTLSELRIDDRSEPASSIVWCSAAALASAPRPFVWLIGLNSGRWPRHIAEDRLIQDHVIPLDELDPLPVAEADRRDFCYDPGHSRALGHALLQPSRCRRAAAGAVATYRRHEPDLILLAAAYLSTRRAMPIGCWRARASLRVRRSDVRGCCAGTIWWYRQAPTAHDGVCSAPVICASPKPWRGRNRPVRCAYCYGTQSGSCGNTRSAGGSPRKPKSRSRSILCPSATWCTRCCARPWTPSNTMGVLLPRRCPGSTPPSMRQ